MELLRKHPKVCEFFFIILILNHKYDLIMFFSFRKYYIDVKRRENAFILNPNSSSLDSIPLKAVR